MGCYSKIYFVSVGDFQDKLIKKTESEELNYEVQEKDEKEDSRITT